MTGRRRECALLPPVTCAIGVVRSARLGVLGVFDTIALGGILLARLSTGILLARSGLDVVLIVIGAGIPALGLPGLPTLLRPTGLRRRWPNGCARVELLSALDLLAGTDRNTLERLAAADGAASHPVSHPRHVRPASSGSSAQVRQ